MVLFDIVKLEQAISVNNDSRNLNYFQQQILLFSTERGLNNLVLNISVKMLPFIHKYQYFTHFSENIYSLRGREDCEHPRDTMHCCLW